MSVPSRTWRLTLLMSGMALLAVAILWSAVTSWRAGLNVRQRFERVRAEGSHVSGHLRDSVLELRSLLIIFEVTGAAADWQTFQARSQALERWIGEAVKGTEGAEERAVFSRTRAAFAAYRAEAEGIAQTRTRDEARQTLIPRLERIEQASKPLLVLGTELAQARRSALGQYVTESERAIVRMQQVIFASLLVFVAFAGCSVVVIYRDTIAPLQTRLVETKEIAAQQEKLAALGVLAAGVAHEIRNPLTAIKARLYTQQKSLAAGSPAHADAVFIGTEIDRLARITTEFLAFARPAEPIMEDIPAAELFRRVRELLGPKMREEEIEVETEPRTELQVHGDSHQLQQVLINLVQNAAESIGRGGHILLRSGREEVPLSGRLQRAVVLEVEDSGKGIPPEIEQRLFDPFFTTKPAGTGLGLSIAARIVEKHGGAIRYETRLDRGATFAVILPSAEKA